MIYRPSLSRLAIIYSVGNLTSKTLSFLLVFGLTFYLDKEDIGEYDLILTTLGLISPCISLQVDSAIFRWLMDDSSPKNKNLTFTASSFILIVSLSVFSIIYLVFFLFNQHEFAIQLYLLSVLLAILPVLQQSARGLRQNRDYISSGIIYSSLYCFLSFIIFYFFKPDISGILTANILASFTAVIFLFIRTKYYLNLSFDFLSLRKSKQLLAYSLPLLPNSLSWWLILSSTRYIIQHYMGDQSNGIFAIAYRYPSIIILFAGIFNLAWQEKSLENIRSKDSNEYYSSVLNNYIRLIFGLAIIFTASSKFLIKYMTQASFFEAWVYIPILLLATAYQGLATFHGAIYLSCKNTSQAFISSLIGGLVTVIMSFALIQHLGLGGISLAILAGFLIMLVIRVRDSKKIYAYKFPVSLVLQLTTLLVILGLVSSVENIWLYMANFILSVAIFIIYNRNLLYRYLLKIL